MMRMFRTSNPIYRSIGNARLTDRSVTYAGVGFKTMLMLTLMGAVAYYVYLNLASLTIPLLIGSVIVGFIAVMIGMSSVRLSPYFALLYAVCEGVIIGAVSSLAAIAYEGIVPTALMTTVIVFYITMLLYSTNIIKVNQRFLSFVIVAMISVIVMSLLGIFLPFGGGLYTLVSLGSALLATLYLFIDFENIKRCVESGTDAAYSWILSLGLMVSLVWLYLDILRLLMIFGRNRR